MGVAEPGSVRQFGKMFWQRVRKMMLSVPEADNFDTQVGLMYFVLMDVQFLCLQGVSEGWSHLLSQESLISCDGYLILALRENSFRRGLTLQI